MKKLICWAVAALLPVQLSAQMTVTVPAGTAIYGELEEGVTSKKKETTEGDIVRARVWRNVVIDGQTVIEAGAPIVLRVSQVKPAKIAGRKGEVELEAVSTRTVDGNEILLDGGYDKSGKSRKGLSITLFAVVAWPLIFLKGKQAELPAGTVFDGSIQADKECTVEGSAVAAPKIRLGGVLPNLKVEPLYDEMDETGKDPNLPVALELCAAGELASANVITVNDQSVASIKVPISNVTAVDNCSTGRGLVDLKEVGKHFVKGINRFEIEVGSERVEIVLDVEL